MTRISRRGALGLASAGLLAGRAGAQPLRYPERAVTIVVPGAPGGGGDFTARLLADALTPALGQSVVVENRAGAAGNIAASAVARAAPDGYTLLLAYSGTHVANPALFRNLAWDPIRSFAPVALVLKAPHVIVVRKDLPARTLAELVAYAKANPGRLNYASSGVGTIQHIGGEELARHVGAPMVHVPYRGAGPAMNDIVAGTMDMIITTPPAVVGLVQQGAVRALAITSPQRHPMLPEVPTTAEAGLPGFELEAWFGIYAPAGTPAPVVARLSEEIRRAVEAEDFRRRSLQSGTHVAYMGPEQLAEFTRTELAHWSGVIERLGIKLE
jgi:tripartite-type tricarboxylate transporter receptor subunit TctC